MAPAKGTKADKTAPIKGQAKLSSFFGKKDGAPPSAAPKASATPSTTGNPERDDAAQSTAQGTPEKKESKQVVSSPAVKAPAAPPSEPQQVEEQVVKERRSKKVEDKVRAASPPEPAAAPARKRRRIAEDDGESDEEEVEAMQLAEPAEKKSKAESGGKATREEAPAAAVSTGGAEEDGESGDEMEVEEEAKPQVRTLNDALKCGRGGGKAKAKAGAKKKVTAFADTTHAVLKRIHGLEEAAVGGKGMPYRFFADVLDAIEGVTARLEITAMARELLIKAIELCPQDVVTLVYLMTSEFAPAYEGQQLGLAEKTLVGAVAKSVGCSERDLSAKLKEEGDLGMVAQTCKSSQRTLGFSKPPPPMTVREVLDNFRKIAACSGGSSVKTKTDIVHRMLLRCEKDGSEAKYLIRGLQGKLRVRLQEATVLAALAHAFVLTPPAFANLPPAPTEAELAEMSEPCRRLAQNTGSKDDLMEAAEAVVKQAFSECPNYDQLVSALLEAPLWVLPLRCRLTPGIPVKPMLAKPSDSFDEVLKRMAGQSFTMEYKYDGERAQIHRTDDGKIHIYSRNLEDLTSKYPDVLSKVPKALTEGVSSFVLDSEVVAIDPESGTFKPFQTLLTRKKKDEKEEDVKVPVRVQAFDLIFLNGEPLLQRPLQERRRLLRESFKHVEGDFHLAVSQDAADDGDTLPIETFLDEAVRANCEGLMIKTLDGNATYEPTRRSLNWLKLKKDYLASADGVGDSLDLVVIGAYHGRGKRVGWFGAFLLACYDPDLEEYQSVCKIGTGFSEEILAKFREELEAHVVERKPGYYKSDDTLACDVWFTPKATWEVKAADLTLSTVHKGGLGKVESGKGIGLRFPRFLRERPDKKPENATSADQVVDMFRSQACIQNQGKKAKGDDDDDDGFI